MSRATINIVLRFDDPSPTTDHALEREIFTILGELDIPVTVGVVPFGIDTGGLVPLTRDNVSHLVAAHAKGIIEVAQHGYAHEHLTTTPKGSPSEFWDVPAEEQYRRIDEGHDQLAQTFGQPIRGFIPPWNTYDNTTLRHLAARGYEYLSSCVATTPQRQFSPCCFVPRTCDIHQLRQAYAEALRHRCLSSTVVAIMHHHDFLEYAGNPGKLSLAAFRETLRWLKQPALHHAAAPRGKPGCGGKPCSPKTPSQERATALAPSMFAAAKTAFDSHIVDVSQTPYSAPFIIVSAR
ncbi:DUF2334 domain-containing protein [Sulfuriferula sp. GW1]|uniref:DUF2334 domain-containing protein n=1 Tax=Sulfuriferula sp. GW1 TaxID=3345111 RepID=UPI0039B058B2